MTLYYVIHNKRSAIGESEAVCDIATNPIDINAYEGKLVSLGSIDAPEISNDIARCPLDIKMSSDQATPETIEIILKSAIQIARDSSPFELSGQAIIDEVIKVALDGIDISALTSDDIAPLADKIRVEISDVAIAASSRIEPVISFEKEDEIPTGGKLIG